MFAAAFRLQPADLLSAWRPQALVLHLLSGEAPHQRDRAAARIELAGQPVAATVLGTVLEVWQAEGGCAFDLAPDAESLPALRLLLAAARGGSIRFLPRPARYLVRLPATVSYWSAARVLMTTTSISENGCGLLWSGPLPATGLVLQVRVEAPHRVAVNQGVICWRSQASPSSTAGVRLLGGPASSLWPDLVSAVARGGAPRA